MFMVVWASCFELDHVYPTANMYRPLTTNRRRKLKSLSRFTIQFAANNFVYTTSICRLIF